jgi:hypothetical protein
LHFFQHAFDGVHRARCDADHGGRFLHVFASLADGRAVRAQPAGDGLVKGAGQGFDGLATQQHVAQVRADGRTLEVGVHEQVLLPHLCGSGHDEKFLQIA